jgi:hypothetical protein
MARRPNDLPNDAMNKKQIEELHRELSMLSPYHVREKYKTLLDKCRFLELASPRMMQELVTLWKLLWRWRR